MDDFHFDQRKSYIITTLYAVLSCGMGDFRPGMMSESGPTWSLQYNCAKSSSKLLVGGTDKLGYS